MKNIPQCIERIVTTAVDHLNSIHFWSSVQTLCQTFDVASTDNLFWMHCHLKFKTWKNHSVFTEIACDSGHWSNFCQSTDNVSKDCPMESVNFSNSCHEILLQALAGVFTAIFMWWLFTSKSSNVSCIRVGNKCYSITLIFSVNFVSLIKFFSKVSVKCW